jgi:hypothetical protein
MVPEGRSLPSACCGPVGAPIVRPAWLYAANIPSVSSLSTSDATLLGEHDLFGMQPVGPENASKIQRARQS